MGCSASKPDTIIAKNHHHSHHCLPPEDNPSSSSSASLESITTLSSSSNSYSFSPKKNPRRAVSLPTPLIHHPPSRKGDTDHFVSLTSTSYGSLLLIDKNPSLNEQEEEEEDNNNNQDSDSDHHQPQIPTTPDSVINTWELMDGLDDYDDDGFGSGSSSKPISSNYENPIKDSKPLWKHLSEESLLSKMDPIVASSYIRALSCRKLGYNNPRVKKARSLDSSPAVITSSSLSSSSSSSRTDANKNHHQIVIYVTSLRGIRKTYEECCSVRMIFKGFRVAIDERDISMDSAYRKELESLIGGGGGGKSIALPQVFIKGRHIGGAEEIKHLNEVGELAKILQGFPVKDPIWVCESCGDARFVPCPSCCGSRKVFDKDEDQLKRCSDCNENGLIRCPACCCC